MEQYAETLRGSYDVTVSAVDAQGKERRTYSMRSIDHEAEQAINNHESGFGADGTRAFHLRSVPSPDQHRAITQADIDDDVLRAWNGGLSMMLVGFFGYWIATGNLSAALGVIRQVPATTASSYSLCVIPLFILMGNAAF
ncbi:MAG: hypothetical protein LIO57_09170, partial [Oscillospiraceae bacterium]|nr:hypothetical protein [Oscillospiraceae bacterium]